MSRSTATTYAMPVLHEALKAFAKEVTTKSTQTTPGEPEAQLRGPFEMFMTNAATALDWNIVITDETPLSDNKGRPDFAINRNGLLVGYVELKAPGTGTDSRKFKGHNKDQFKRFINIPNLLYTDGNEWALYRSGKLAHKTVLLSGDVATESAKAVSADDSSSLENLLRDYFQWEPHLPLDKNGKLKLPDFADRLAPLCRMLRDSAESELEHADSLLEQLADEWRAMLFPGASNKQFADTYAQTVTFALLLARSQGTEPLTLINAEETLKTSHGLLSLVLKVFTDQPNPSSLGEINPALQLLLRVIGAVDVATFTATGDPWLNFYEDFLAAYDPKLRKNAGVYYTPAAVVQAQVRLVDDILTSKLGIWKGMADNRVIVLDPAIGTGTYLLGMIDHAMAKIKDGKDQGAVAGHASELAKRIFGFELLVGPYAVAQLRVTKALTEHGAEFTRQGANIFLADTLEDPNVLQFPLPTLYEPITREREKAREVKRDKEVIVCLGNPPYGRHVGYDSEADNRVETGSWVRHGTGTNHAILDAFIKPVKDTGLGHHLKNIYNLYVYFWCWALWKVFKQNNDSGAKDTGIISFITASSYLDGPAFVGMRWHMRKICDDIWLIDLGGDSRGAIKEENVFNIQTPVVIAFAVRSKPEDENTPATVRYTKITGTRAEKLNALNSLTGLSGIKWETCDSGWQDSFKPAPPPSYTRLPLLSDLMPLQISGLQIKRTWPVAPDKDTLERRWRELLRDQDKDIRTKKFRETGGRKIDKAYHDLKGNPLVTISALPYSEPVPLIARFSYRSFDRQYLIFDNRLLDCPRPALQDNHSDKQIYFSSRLTTPLGKGPALTATSIIPDLDNFMGSSGGKSTIPLFQTTDIKQANILPGLLELLSTVHGFSISPEDFAAHVYGLLAHPAYYEYYSEELKSREQRVPLTKDGDLFSQLADIGRNLLWLHTYGERYVPIDDKRSRGEIARGAAHYTTAVPQNEADYPDSFSYDPASLKLFVGDGEFSEVPKDVWEFSVSGMQVVKKWLRYRMKQGAGKKSSPLDDVRPKVWTSQFTDELLQLLWVLEHTLAGYPAQKKLFDDVVSGDLFEAKELPDVPKHMRKPPEVKHKSPKTDPG